VLAHTAESKLLELLQPQGADGEANQSPEDVLKGIVGLDGSGQVSAPKTCFLFTGANTFDC
jgi:hypothetical protein